MKLAAAAVIQLLLLLGLKEFRLMGRSFEPGRWAFSEIYKTLKK